MKISKSKKELARIISENGGWRDGSGYSVMGTNGEVFGHLNTPKWSRVLRKWTGSECFFMFRSASPTPNYQRTILSRAEYFHTYPVPDADGWIEWQSPFFGEMPVGEDEVVDIRVGNEVHIGFSAKDWKMWGVVTHYRLHKPEQAEPEFCESVMRSIPGLEAKPTIEQLAADYQQAVMLAEIKQQDADAAKGDADAKLKSLELAGEALGLLVSPITAKQEPELAITDWRDLRVGDEVELLVYQGGSGKVGEVGVISKVCGGGDFFVNFPSQSEYSVDHADIKFIRRQ